MMKNTLTANKLNDLFTLMRPNQWIKNSFVLMGFLFHAQYINTPLLFEVLAVALAFCLFSSSVYIFNDLIDIQADQAHEEKRHRPLPSGKVSPKAAKVLGLLLASLGFLLGYTVSITALLCLTAYLAINILYSLFLKKVVIIDVFCISAGFMLRILAGTSGVGIIPSKWLLLCGMMITLFLGFGKRRAEIFHIGVENKQRKVLDSYKGLILDQLITICAAGTLIAYCFYTISEHTLLTHQTENLIYTIPIVIYALFRYIYLLHNHQIGENPSKELLRDPHLLGSLIAWTITVVVILH